MNRSHACCWMALIAVFLLATHHAEAAEKSKTGLTVELRKLDTHIVPAESDLAKQLGTMLSQDARRRIQQARLRENKAWYAVKTKADWEAFRDQRIGALERSLGSFPPVPRDLQIRVTGKRKGEGYRVHNLVYVSRPGLVVTANLYLPTKPRKSMPGILISHSHHNPKTQGELQDMGMTWARQGCIVLVPDHVGHGERRQHPFTSAKSYPGRFRVGRQDYYFRYNTALQLRLVGESLMGWMVWDLMRGVDVLLAQPGIDRSRIILLGAVAGGGDPAGVTAALDSRIAAVAPFNFGGPQPDYAIPDNADRDFYFFGVSYWESTRCLRLSARDGFAHWVIVSSVAPRRLLYCHEFGWSARTDPVWPRMQKVFALYGKPDRLAVAAGKGILRGRPPENTHCGNIGAYHRSKMYPTLKKWFGIAPPEKDYSRRRDTKELTCLTPRVTAELKPQLVHRLASDLGQQQTLAFRKRLQTLKPKARREVLRKHWTRLLGDIKPAQAATVTKRVVTRLDGVITERLVLEVEPGIHVPLVLLLPRTKGSPPVVVGLCQQGKKAFLQQQAEAIAGLLQSGVGVCLPDVRGSGETRPRGGSRHWRGGETSISQTNLMLGQPLLGARLRDVRSVLGYLSSRKDLAKSRLALWGDSFAAVNPPDRNLRVPLDANDLPAQAEPLGGLLALFGALFEDRVQAIFVHRGLSSYASALQSSFVYIPHDVAIPGALTSGELCDVASALAPRPLRLAALIDGMNREVTAPTLKSAYAPTRSTYQHQGAAGSLEMETRAPSAQSVVRWFTRALKGD